MITAYVSERPSLDLDYFHEEFLEVHHLGSLEAFLQLFETIKHRGVALIYHIEGKEDLEKLREIPFLHTLFVILIGPSSIDLVLQAGQLGVDEYIVEEEASEKEIAQLLLKGQKYLKKKIGSSNVTVFTGIHGGSGTTTIALNTAILLANEQPQSRILFIDLAFTKGIVHLFFDNPNPPKHITSLFHEEYSDIHSLLDNGIYRYGNNCYYIPGIESHSDKEELEKPENIQKMIHLITQAKEYFNHIIVDVGVFQDIHLAIDIQEMADSIYAVSTLSIPAISVLSTYLLITERSGWRTKTNILINRYDSNGAISILEAKKFLSKSTKRAFRNYLLLPNDWMVLQRAWNDVEIAALEYKKSRFVTALKKMVQERFTTQQMQRCTKPFFRKILPWG